jgi:hypothetical protein
MHRRERFGWRLLLARGTSLLLGLCAGGCGAESFAGGDGAAGATGAQPGADNDSDASRSGPSSGPATDAAQDGARALLPAVVVAPSLLPRVTVRVVDLVGLPLPAATVHLAAQTQRTDAAGHARFSDVQVPYAAMVEAGGDGYVFFGLSRAAPTLHLSFAQSVNADVLSGALVGLAGAPATPGARLMSQVGFVSDAGSFQSPALQAQFSLPTGWLDASNGVVRAMQYEYDAGGELGGYPENFMVYGEAATDADADSVTVAMSPIRQQTVSGTSMAPAAATPNEVCLQLLFEDGAHLQFRRIGGQRDTFRYPVPIIAGAQARLAWGFTYPNQSQVHLLERVSSGDQLELDVPLPLQLTAPEPGAEGVAAGTRFAFSNPGEGVHAVVMHSKAVVDGPTVVLYVDDVSVRLPDLSAVGISLPLETAYTWTAWALRGVGSVDELVAAADYAQRCGCGQRAATRIHAFVSGPPSEFLTAAH